jgi:integrase
VTFLDLLKSVAAINNRALSFDGTTLTGISYDAAWSGAPENIDTKFIEWEKIERKVGSYAQDNAVVYEAFDNDVIESNPAEKLSTPRVEHKPKDALTTDEAIMLMHYGNKRERAIIATFLNTGIRVQELIDIKFVDYIKEPSKMVLKTKRGKYRTVYLNDDTIKLINEYLKVRKEGCDNLFVSNQGTPLSEYSLNNTWKKLATKAGIDKHITNHSFRSTFVTTIAREHGILMAQMAVNHANIATTRIYVRGMEDEVEAVVRGLKVC